MILFLFRANRTEEVVDCINYLNIFYGCQNDEVFQLFVQTAQFLEFIAYFCDQSESNVIAFY